MNIYFKQENKILHKRSNKVYQYGSNCTVYDNSSYFIKYQFVCEVTVDGEKLGYVTDKEQFEQSVNEIINREEENKLFTTIAKMPEYHFKFVDKTESTNSEEILAKIESSAETTYKIYAVTIDGKEKVKVANLEEAESLVKN